MAQATIKDGQTWWNIGIELSGAWEAGVDLSLSLGVSMTETPPNGVEVKTHKTYNRPMEQYCHADGVSPATLRDGTGVRWQIFSPIFNTIFR